MHHQALPGPYDKFGTKYLSQCLCYRTTQDGYTYKRDGKLALSNSALITLDWSEDSYNIAAVTADFHLVHAGKSLFYMGQIYHIIKPTLTTLDIFYMNQAMYSESILL